MTHERFREIPLAQAVPDRSSGSRDCLRIVLFWKDEKLRSHAVKHVTNFSETANAGAQTSLNESEITICVSRLQELGCPYFVEHAFEPPCEGPAGRCGLYESCTPHVRDLEQAYLDMVSDALREGGAAPRYAMFYSDWDENDMFCLMPDRPMVVKAAMLEGGDYNLMTCYADAGLSFSEMRNMQLEKIRNEARRRNLNLCSREGWGVVSEDQDARASRDDNGKMKKRLKPYKRESGGWRRYLDGLEEEFDELEI
ncbi:MAG: hypothetical protein ACLFOY_02185 [Desulfatibacillaceae bacterium]